MSELPYEKRKEIDRIKRVLFDLFGGHQENFALAIGIDKSVVTNWLKHRHGVTTKSLIKIANALQSEVNFNWMVEGKGEPYLEQKNRAQKAEYQQQIAEAVADKKKDRGASAYQVIKSILEEQIAKNEIQARAIKEVLAMMDDKLSLTD